MNSAGSLFQFRLPFQVGFRHSSSKVNASIYCSNLVRQRDYERFLATLLLPRSVQRAAFAIRAFNVEVSGVRDAVSDSRLGQIRLQFWKDSIDKCFDNSTQVDASVPDHPVIRELAWAIRDHKLSRELLHKVIQGREEKMSDKPFESFKDLDDYSQKTFSSINYLILEALTGNDNGHARHAANHIGKAEGVVTLLRSIPYHASKRRVLLPSDIMSQQRLSAESIIRKKDLDKLELVVEAVAGRAQEHLESARFRSKYLSRDEKLVMLPAVGVDKYLGLLAKVQCDVFDQVLFRRNSLLPLHLYIHKLKRSF